MLLNLTNVNSVRLLLYPYPYPFPIVPFPPPELPSPRSPPPSPLPRLPLPIPILLRYGVLPLLIFPYSLDESILGVRRGRLITPSLIVVPLVISLALITLLKSITSYSSWIEVSGVAMLLRIGVSVIVIVMSTLSIAAVNSATCFFNCTISFSNCCSRPAHS